MSEKQLRLWIILGLGAYAAYYIWKQKNNAAIAAIQPVTITPAVNAIPALRGSLTS